MQGYLHVVKHLVELMLYEELGGEARNEEAYKAEQPDDAYEADEDGDGHPHDLGSLVGVVAVVLHLMDVIALWSQECNEDVAILDFK